jgi:GTP-binding protein EngB required for normal cell division
MTDTLTAFARRAEIALEASGLHEAAAAARAQLGRLDDPLVTAAILGEFKRGKSTLVNALVNQAVLPAGVLPLTAVRTAVEVTADGSPAAEVRYRTGDRETITVDAIARYATEEGNPGNRRGVTEVSVHVHARTLAGVRLIDTPGLASPFADTAAAAEPVVGDADLAVLVLAADQPASRAELELLERTAVTLPTVVVVNRMDAIDAGDRRRVLGFIVEQVRRAVSGPVHVLGVSARGALEGFAEWREPLEELRTIILEAARGADRAARVRAALHELLAAAVSQAALRLRAPRLEQEARAAYETRRARDVELTVLGAGPRIRAAGTMAADAILNAVAAVEERPSLRDSVSRAVVAAATSAVRSGHEPGAAGHAALGFLLSRWSAAEARALEDAVPAAESKLRNAVRDTLGRELGPDVARTLVSEVAIVVAAPRPHLPALPRYRSALPGPLGEWRILRRFRADVGRVVDAAMDSRRAAVDATVRAAIDQAVRSVLDRVAPSAREDYEPAPPSGDPAAALRSLLVELGG